METQLRILLLEDSPNDAELIRVELERGKIQHILQCVSTRAEFLVTLSLFKPDLLIADYSLPDITGTEALSIAREQYPNLPVILVTGALGEELAIETIKGGATDYILKDRLYRLAPAVLRAVNERRHRTQHEQAEQELRQSEERFRQLTESIREVFWLTNADKTELIYVSPSYEEIWGRTCESLYGAPNNWAQAIHSDDRERVIGSALINQVSGQYDEEYRIVRPDGSIRWIQDRAFPVRDASGKVYRIAGLAEDITRHKQAEESLRQAEANYRSIFENANEGIFQTTPDGHFRSANPALASMLGYESPAGLINDVKDLGEQICIDPQSRLELKQRLESDGSVRNFENEIFRKDGSRMWISVNAHVVRDASGQPLYYEGTSRNITQRKRAEKVTAATVELGHRLSAVSTPKQAAAIILDVASNLIGWDSGSVHSYSQTANNFAPLLIFDSKGEQLLSSEIPETHFMATLRLIMEEGGRVFNASEAASLGVRFSEFEATNECQASTMCVPIRLGNTTLGVVSLQSRKARGYSTDDLELLQTLANHCGDALERIRIADALRTTESKYRTIFENATDGIFQATPEGRFVVANPALACMFGYDSPEEMLSSFVQQECTFVLPERLAELKRLVTEHGFVTGFEAERFRKDRSTFWVSMNVRAVRDDDGAFLFFEGTEQDITQRKNAESVLREAEANYRSIFENATEGIFRTTPAGRYLNANPALARILGYESPEALISSVTDIGDQFYVQPEQRIEIRRLLETVGQVQGYEVEGYRKDGTKFWMSINARSVRDASGTIIHYEGTAQDITQRKMTIEALRESERKLRLIAENTADAIFAFDMERRLVFVNSSVEGLTGYTLAEIQEKQFINWLHPDDQQRMMQYWEQLYRGEGYSEIEFRLITKGGQIKWCSSTWGPLFDESGRQIGVQGRERDITERKELEREVLESTSNERRRIGHELHDGLGQYLAGIAFRAKALEQTLSSEAVKYAPEAKELTGLISNAISQTRSLARGLDPIQVETIGLPAALQNLTAETAKFFEIPCLFRCEESALSVEPQKALALYRIAQEAIHNAITHGQARQIEIDLTKDLQHLRLRIKDNGVGFEIETKKSPGMGLRVMRYRARSIGGNLTINSRLNQGTQISCLVPVTVRLPEAKEGNNRKPDTTVENHLPGRLTNGAESVHGNIS